MIRRAVGITLFVCAALALFYISRFWDFRLWQGNLLGIEGLRPQGGLLARWLRGTPLAPYELLVWLTGGFLVLTALERMFTALWPVPEGGTGKAGSD